MSRTKTKTQLVTQEARRTIRKDNIIYLQKMLPSGTIRSAAEAIRIRYGPCRNDTYVIDTIHMYTT